MRYKDRIETKSIPVYIKVIMIDKRRMTKSFFNQIILSPCFDNKCKFIGDEILGFVIGNHNTKYIVWSQNGNLRRTRLIENREEIRILNFQLFLKFDFIEFDDQEDLIKLYLKWLHSFYAPQIFI